MLQCKSLLVAVAQAQRYVAEGYGVVVDLDLENSSTGSIMTA